jgi:hypothetical protein
MGRSEESHKNIRIIGILDRIQTKHLLNVSLKCYSYAIFLPLCHIMDVIPSSLEKMQIIDICMHVVKEKENSHAVTE